MTVPDSTSTDAARIRAELEALGEAPLDDLELHAAGWDDEDEPLAFAARLHELAASATHPELDEVARERAWKTVATRLGPRGARSRGTGGGAGGPSTRWRAPLLLAAAVVAAALLLPRLDGDGEPRGTATAQTAALGDSARAGLRALGVEHGPGADAARVRELIEATTVTVEGSAG